MSLLIVFITQEAPGCILGIYHQPSYNCNDIVFIPDKTETEGTWGWR